MQQFHQCFGDHCIVCHHCCVLGGYVLIVMDETQPSVGKKLPSVSCVVALMTQPSPIEDSRTRQSQLAGVERKKTLFPLNQRRGSFPQRRKSIKRSSHSSSRKRSLPTPPRQKPSSPQKMATKWTQHGGIASRTTSPATTHLQLFPTERLRHSGSPKRRRSPSPYVRCQQSPIMAVPGLQLSPQGPLSIEGMSVSLQATSHRVAASTTLLASDSPQGQTYKTSPQQQTDREQSPKRTEPNTSSPGGKQ